MTPPLTMPNAPAKGLARAPKAKPVLENGVPKRNPVLPKPNVKALVVHSPYAQEIASGEKDIEYRSWSCQYRGWLAIIAARRRESGADAGRMVCLVKLVDVVDDGAGGFEWMLANPIPLTERIEIPGRLGLFDVTDKLPASALAMIEAHPPMRAVKRHRQVKSDEQIIREYRQAYERHHGNTAANHAIAEAG